MSTSIAQSFVKQFEREVHEAYQRMGSKLRGTVRTKNNVQGASTVFQKVGKGAASTKSRHGVVPVMNSTTPRSNARCMISTPVIGWIGSTS